MISRSRQKPGLPHFHLPPGGLDRGHPGVHHQHGSGDVGGLVAGQVGGGTFLSPRVPIHVPVGVRRIGLMIPRSRQKPGLPHFHLPPGGLDRGHPGVHHQHGSGDVGGLVAGQVGGGTFLSPRVPIHVPVGVRRIGLMISRSRQKPGLPHFHLPPGGLDRGHPGVHHQHGSGDVGGFVAGQVGGGTFLSPRVPIHVRSAFVGSA